METFEEYKARKISEDPQLSRSSDVYLRQVFKADYGVWPEESGGELKQKAGVHTTAQNLHKTLDTVASIISACGWLVVVLGVILFAVGLSTIDSRGGLGVVGIFYGLATIVTGVLLVANGQLLSTVGQIEQNTQNTAKSIEKLIDRMTV